MFSNLVFASRHMLEGVIVVEALFHVNASISTSPEDVISLIETSRVHLDSAENMRAYLQLLLDLISPY